MDENTVITNTNTHRNTENSQIQNSNAQKYKYHHAHSSPDQTMEKIKMLPHENCQLWLVMVVAYAKFSGFAKNQIRLK